MSLSLETKIIRTNSTLSLKIDSLRTRARLLTNLRAVLSLKPPQDLTDEQWEALESQLTTVSTKVRQQLRIYADKFYSDRNDLSIRQTLINRLGELEVDLTNAYGFYDTYMDILTQRLSNDIGPKLKGCDAIAAYALHHGDLQNICIDPIVYCERGFGASTLREGVDIIRNTANPIPFIAIPYSRISEKYNLISIFHEVGHQALVKLNMVGLWQKVFYESIKKAGGSSLVCNFYANWSKEIVPDFWAFCLSGMGQTCSIRDVLILPKNMMFNISNLQPHPPSYLRFLFSIECCKQLWGRGVWDSWQEEWESLYTFKGLDEATKQLIIEAKRYVSVISRALLYTKFKKLNAKPLMSLFSLDEIAPSTINHFASLNGVDSTGFKKCSIGFQLAVFRMMRERQDYKQAQIDVHMDKWLKQLLKAN